MVPARQHPSCISTSATNSGAIGRVLVVDDLPANITLITKVLERDGYEVVSATNGQEAIELTRRSAPDLVLLDVQMAGLNGFETCRALKEDLATRLIPIVLVTALQNTEDRLEGIDAGADDFITKPFNTLELRARIRSLIYKPAFDSERAYEKLAAEVARGWRRRDLFDAFIQARSERLDSHLPSMPERGHSPPFAEQPSL